MTGIAPLWAIVAFALVLLCMGFLFLLVIRLRSRLTKFMTGKDGASLETTLQWVTKKIAETDETLDTHKEALKFIDRRVQRSIRGYSLIRYDAYLGAGGGQSFSSGLLDEHGDGYILSVVSNRNHTGVYAKRVTAGTAESSLTEEEAKALHEAKKGIK
jgi:hypothetical protein